MNEDPATNALFAYGSLQIEEVMEAVTGRRFDAIPATLDAHRRRRLRDRSYPGVVEDPAEATEGVLFLGLDDETFAILDLFEDDPYRRVVRPVRTRSGLERSAFVYLIRDDHAHLMSDEAWDLAAFRDGVLTVFVEQCRAFAREVRRGSPYGRPD